MNKTHQNKHHHMLILMIIKFRMSENRKFSSIGARQPSDSHGATVRFTAAQAG
jgi:hypothetical protein